MPTVDATVKGTGANSYVTLAEASSFHAESVYGSAWAAYSSTQQGLAVITATRMLDDYVDWSGYKATDEQALRWPRYGVDDRDGYYFEDDQIPTFLVNATSEFAKYILDNIGTDITASPDTKGFKSLQADVLRIEVDKADRDSDSVLPQGIVVMVEPYGTVRTKSGFTTAEVVRS